eukprot:1477583-Pleurochrysis_carterae.AAC.1
MSADCAEGSRRCVLLFDSHSEGSTQVESQKAENSFKTDAPARSPAGSQHADNPSSDAFPCTESVHAESGAEGFTGANSLIAAMAK